MRKENVRCPMCGTMNYDVDFDAIKAAKPKWYMGYSDNTNFTFLLTTICDVASIYGPCAGTFGMEPWDESIEDCFSIFTGKKLMMQSYPLWEKEGLRDEEHPLEPYNLTEQSLVRGFLTQKDHTGEVQAFETEGTIEFKGRLIGGCMDCLVNLTGTRFDKTKDFIERYKEDGIIWFLEACDLNVFSIRRAMWQMEQAGWFEHVRAFLIGRPLCFGQDMMGLDPYQAVLPVALSHHVPVIMDVDLGHLPPMMPLIVGSLADVTVSGNDIRIDMQLR